MECMHYIMRLLENQIAEHLQRGKSILLLGPRQTGKSTLLSRFQPDLIINLILSEERRRYEANPSIIQGEVKSIYESKGKKPLIFLDEIQKVPNLLDEAQYLIDNQKCQFIISGSSARKLKRENVNLLPGRVVSLRLDPILYLEQKNIPLKNLLLYGSLPSILLEEKNKNKEIDLESYVETYLEEEIRKEALVRNVGLFARFLEYASVESGNVINFRALATELGIYHTTISGYFEILEDCLISERIDAYTKSLTRKKLAKSSKYLLFDLGVRRVCAKEGKSISEIRFGELFQQFVGLELIRTIRAKNISANLKYWKDLDGPEIDWLVEFEHELIPIEVKWNESPPKKSAKHLITFLNEYPEAKRGYVICRTPRSYNISEGVEAIPWEDMYNKIFNV